MSYSEINRKELHLIDGHNLLHFNFKLKKLYKINAIQSIQWIITSCGKWALEHQFEVKLYFDGKQKTKLEQTRNVQVFQSGVDKSADELIINHCSKWHKKSSLYVYTEDKELAKKCVVKGAEIKSNKALAKILFPEAVSKSETSPKMKKEKMALQKQQNKASKREVDEMLLLYHLREMDQRDERES